VTLSDKSRPSLSVALLYWSWSTSISNSKTTFDLLFS